jgi:hypothetical protein
VNVVETEMTLDALIERLALDFGELGGVGGMLAAMTGKKTASATRLLAEVEPSDSAGSSKEPKRKVLLFGRRR